MKKPNLTKLEVAEKQLNTAIFLFFTRKDLISVHTLISASYGIIYDLSVHNSMNSKSYIRGNKSIKLNKKKEFFDMLNEPQNFFKHADNDSEHKLEFNPVLSEWFILDSINLLQLLTKKEKFPHNHSVYLTWFNFKYADLEIFKDAGFKGIQNQIIKDGLSYKDYDLFFNHLEVD